MRRFVREQILVLLLVAPLVSEAKPFYIHSTEAVLRSEPAFGGKELATLSRGEKVDRQAKKGHWYQVRAGQRQGWVLRSLVGETPPVAEEKTELGEEGSSIREDARRRASGVITAGAARGLKGEDARARRSFSESSNYADLDRLMRLKIPSEAQKAFARGDAP